EIEQLFTLARIPFPELLPAKKTTNPKTKSKLNPRVPKKINLTLNINTLKEETLDQLKRKIRYNL
ncbi:MAG: hypothetical protein LBC74_03375, partial [Planctomycetaceae bacterium]|nr:hypothetical protein [Planctomycetaceae bacterium]